MKLRTSGKLPRSFLASELPKTPPEMGQVVIVVAEVRGIQSVDLPDHEKEKAKAYSHASARDRYLAGRSLVRGILGGWFGILPEEVPLVLGASGKPFFPGERSCHFSLSHTAELVGVAFSASPVGIDLEREREVDVQALAKRFFSPEEASYLRQNPSKSDFFRLWCCREAVSKADGRGLGELLATLRVHHPESGNEMIDVSAGGNCWKTIPWILPGQVHGAVAFREEPSLIRWCERRESIG